MSYRALVTAITIIPEGNALSDCDLTEVRLVDDGGGEYLEIELVPIGGSTAVIRVNPDEWIHLRAAVNRLLKGCKS